MGWFIIPLKRFKNKGVDEMAKKKKQKRRKTIKTKVVVEAFEGAKGKTKGKIKAVAKELGVDEETVKSKLKTWFGQAWYEEQGLRKRSNGFPATKDEVISALNKAYQLADLKERTVKSAFSILKKKHPNLTEQNFRNRIGTWITSGEITKTVKFS